MNRVHRRQVEDDLREAAFRALIAARVARVGSATGGRLYFLSVKSAGKDRDPRPSLMTRFLDYMADDGTAGEPGGPAAFVARVSRARRAGGFVVERGSGRLGTILRITRIVWKGGPEASVNARWFLHPRAAGSVRLSFEQEAGRWVTRTMTEKTPTRHPQRGLASSEGADAT